MGLRSGRRSFGLRLEGNLVFGTALVIPSCSLNKKSAPSVNRTSKNGQ